jgi:hypothetical protein
MVKPPEIVKVYVDLETNILYADVGMPDLQELGFVLSSGTVVDGALVHGSLTALDEDDHVQYIPVDGSRPFLDNVGVSTAVPTDDAHVTRKDYVDSAVLAVSGANVVAGVQSINALSGTLTMVGIGEANVTSAGTVITISGTPHDLPSSTALIGSDGITVISGSSFDTVDGFYAEFVAASGSLQAGGFILAALLSQEIDDDIQTHTELPSAHHSRYTDGEAEAAAATPIATHAAISTAHHTRYTNDENPALTGSDGITIVSGSNTVDVGGFRAEFVAASGFLNVHGNLSGLSNDDHSQYSLVDGTRNFTGDVTINTPSALTVSGINISDGTFSEPAIRFSDDPDSGIMRESTNRLAFVAGGQRVLRLETPGGTPSAKLFGTLLNIDGNSVFPAYSFSNDVLTGISSRGSFTSTIIFTTGAVESGYFGSSHGLTMVSSGIEVPAGTASLPGYTFTSDGTSGFYSVAQDILGISAGGTDRVTISGVGDSTDGVGIPDNLTVMGTVTAPIGTFSDSLTISGVPVITTPHTLLATTTLDAPSDDENFTIMKVIQETTLQKMFAVTRGPGSPSVTWTVKHDTDRSAGGTAVVSAGTTTTNTTTGDVITVMDNSTIPIDSWVWIETTASGGSPQELTVELFS